MHLSLLAFLCLSRLVHAATNDTTVASSICPPPDATSRSVWTILYSCAVTLMICVWSAVHMDVPKPEWKWYVNLMIQVSYIGVSFGGPEYTTGLAIMQWCHARRNVIHFRRKGYKFSMTHSYFANSGGFVYRNAEGELAQIDATRFLALCEAGKIANPHLTVDDVNDKSKSDALGKAIFSVQLVWFIIQVVVRGLNGLAVTLVELDTVSVAMVSMLYIIVWWDKPLRPQRGYVFYATEEGKEKVYPRTELSNAWKSEPGWFCKFITGFCCFCCTRSDSDEEEGSPSDHHAEMGKTMIEKIDPMDIATVLACTTWVFLGLVHLIAWNFEFPTELEHFVWRIASLALTGAPFVLVLSLPLRRKKGITKMIGWVLYLSGYLFGISFRVLLVMLMVLSLRALPCSAYKTVVWTSYIPHI